MPYITKCTTQADKIFITSICDSGWASRGQ